MDLTQTLVEEICNPAIRSIGAKKIPPATPNANMTEVTLCQDLYKSVRDSEIRERIWSCTKKRATLTKEVTDPDYWDWEYQYALPTDCALVISLEYNYVYSIESGYIYTNAKDGDDQIDIKYVQFADTTSGTAVDTEIARFDFGLKNVLAKRLAAEMCPTIAPAKEATAWVKYNDALASAMISNSFEDLHSIIGDVDYEPDCIALRWG